jgi:hypothetical protein
MRFHPSVPGAHPASARSDLAEIGHRARARSAPLARARIVVHPGKKSLFVRVRIGRSDHVKRSRSGQARSVRSNRRRIARHVVTTSALSSRLLIGHFDRRVPAIVLLHPAGPVAGEEASEEGRKTRAATSERAAVEVVLAAATSAARLEVPAVPRDAEAVAAAFAVEAEKKAAAAGAVVSVDRAHRLLRTARRTD